MRALVFVLNEGDEEKVENGVTLNRVLDSKLARGDYEEYDLSRGTVTISEVDLSGGNIE